MSALAGTKVAGWICGMDVQKQVEYWRSSAEEDLEAARSLGIRPGGDDSWEVAFHRIFLSRVEPHLPLDRPLILTDYPAAIPTLAKGRGAYAERWELYMGGVEIANCYSEETDRREVARFLREEGLRKKTCRVDHPADLELADIFDEGYPPCSGVALGMDRLFMVVSGENMVERVIPFPYSRL